MAKDFAAQIDNTYNIPASIMITTGMDPTDIRQTCDTVEDFETFQKQTGMELRYPGLITYEVETGKARVCNKREDGSFYWSTFLSEEEIAELDKRLSLVEDKVFSYDIQFMD